LSSSVSAGILPIEVLLETSFGSIAIELYPDKAPASVARFLSLVEDGSFAQYGTFYRSVRKNENDKGIPSIDVLQGGVRECPRPLTGIRHEPTSETGLRHVDGAVSLARGAVGTATGGAFFICIGDQECLDAGGSRHEDKQGFAVFGKVVQGMQIVRTIHQMKTSGVSADPRLAGQMVDPPVRFVSLTLWK